MPEKTHQENFLCVWPLFPPDCALHGMSIIFGQRSTPHSASFAFIARESKRNTISRLAILFLAVYPCYAASITGDTIACATTGAVGVTCNHASAVAGNGTEFVINLGPNYTQFSFLADFRSTDLLLTARGPNSFSGFTLGGSSNILLKFTDLSNAFASASLIGTTNAGFTAGKLTFSGGTASLAVSNIFFLDGDTINIGFPAGGATAPEPATVALTGVTILLAVCWMRWRKTAREFVAKS